MADKNLEIPVAGPCPKCRSKVTQEASFDAIADIWCIWRRCQRPGCGWYEETWQAP